MAAPSAWTIYHQFKLTLGKKLLDLNADTFKLALFTSASSAINAAVSPATYTDFATDAHEVANGVGYLTGGVSCGAGTFTNSSGTETFDVADASWTASGGSITCRAAVLYDSTDASKRAVAYSILDNAPADVVIADGNTLIVNIAPFFTLV